MYILLLFYFIIFRYCVWVVKLEKVGMGKSLYKKRLIEKFLKKNLIGVLDDFFLLVIILMS